MKAPRLPLMALALLCATAGCKSAGSGATESDPSYKPDAKYGTKDDNARYYESMRDVNEEQRDENERDSK